MNSTGQQHQTLIGLGSGDGRDHRALEKENEELRKKTAALENELQQLRLRAKLRISQLRNQISERSPSGSMELKGSTPVLNNVEEQEPQDSAGKNVEELRQYSAENEQLKTRVAELENQILNTTAQQERAESLSAEIHRLNEALETSKAEASTLRAQLEERDATEKRDRDEVRKASESAQSYTDQLDKNENGAVSGDVDDKEPGGTQGAEMASMEEKLKTSQAKVDMLEGKIRRLKGILAAANKNVTENRDALAQKELEIAALRKAAEESNEQAQKYLGELQRFKDDLKREKESSQSMAVMIRDERDQQKELHQKFTQAIQALETVKSEFQAYKVKAQIALQKQFSDAPPNRTAELEQSKTTLEKQLSNKTAELNAALSRLATLERDFSSACDQLAAQESLLKRHENCAQEIMDLKFEKENLERRLESSRQANEESLKAQENHYASAMNSLKDEIRQTIAMWEAKVRTKQEEVDASHRISESLNNELSALREQLDHTKSELEKIKAAPKPKLTVDTQP
ncbi:hypothetical protein HK102_002194, partial [Quaeritorhiza haematococci]